MKKSHLEIIGIIDFMAVDKCTFLKECWKIPTSFHEFREIAPGSYQNVKFSIFFSSLKINDTDDFQMRFFHEKDQKYVDFDVSKWQICTRPGSCRKFRLKNWSETEIYRVSTAKIP